MTISPAQIKAQGMLLAELKKELDEMGKAYKKSIYPESETIKLVHEGGRNAIKWIRDWIEEVEAERKASCTTPEKV